MGESDKNQDEIKENPAGPEDKDQARDDDQYEKEVINSANPVFPNTTNVPGNIDGGLGIWMGYGLV